MKKLIFTLIAISFSIAVNSQNLNKVYTVTYDTTQNMLWDPSLTLLQAKEKGVIEYPNYGVGHNVWIYDLKNKTATVKLTWTKEDGTKGFYSEKFYIHKINKTDNILNIDIGNLTTTGWNVIIAELQDEPGYTEITRNVNLENGKAKGGCSKHIKLSIK